MEDKKQDRVSGLKLREDVVWVVKEVEKEVGGLLIPENLEEVGQLGYVVGVGPGNEAVKMQVEKGDKIFYCRYAGSEIKIDGQSYMMMRQEDILGKVTGDRKIDLAPLESRVLIEWERGRDEYFGTKIIRPEGAEKERYYTGVIIALGPDVKEVEVGQRVFFNQFCGPERIDFENKRYALIWEHDIYCIIPPREDFMVMSH